jgi:lysophospholipase L1-like esterase
MAIRIIIWFIAVQITGAMALQMASLGSSFAAGPGLRQNYAHILANKLGATLEDLSVSGSTLLNMGSQITRIRGNTEILTVTSGGNDLGYIGGLTKDSLGGGVGDVGGAGGSPISESALLGRFNEDLAKIHEKAPKAKVYLVEYLTILGPDVQPGANVPFNAKRVEHHRLVAATLQRATAKAAEGKDWVKRIPVAEASQKHGIGSLQPWVNGPKGVPEDGVGWHPNSAGMRAIAEMLYHAIKGNETGKYRL